MMKQSGKQKNEKYKELVLPFYFCHFFLFFFSISLYIKRSEQQKVTGVWSILLLELNCFKW